MRIRLLFIIAFMSMLTACGTLTDLFMPTGIGSLFGGDGNSDSTAIEATNMYIIAPGGVASGRDELVIFDSDNKQMNMDGKELTFRIEDETIVSLELRPDCKTFAECSGAKIIPLKTGKTIIHYLLDGVEQSDTFGVIVPPQRLIQILIGEASAQIDSELTEDEHGMVELTSTSPTADALSAVIRNRVLLIESGQPASLFVVNENVWNSDPPSSHYKAVIEANDGSVYQFSPVDPSDVSHENYTTAAQRETLKADWHLAYDQAVLTAGYIYNNTTADPTGGAFGFRTPTQAESICLIETANIRIPYLPSECGPGDENYPDLAPVQIFLMDTIAMLGDSWYSFVFYRGRNELEAAVTKTP